MDQQNWKGFPILKNEYFIIYTRGLLATKDFEHWRTIPWHKDSRFISSQEWAPEFVTAKNGKKFVVMSAVNRGGSAEPSPVSAYYF